MSDRLILILNGEGGGGLHSNHLQKFIFFVSHIDVGGYTTNQT